MQAITSGYHSLAIGFAFAAERLLVPLAVVVGLAGGAMIGAELSKLQAPTFEAIH